VELPGSLVGRVDRQATVLGSQAAVVGSQVAVLGSQDILVGSQAAVVDSQAVVLGSQDIVVGCRSFQDRAAVWVAVGGMPADQQGNGLQDVKRKLLL